MEISISESGDVQILSFQGNLDTGTAPEAESQINALIEAGKRKLLVNFEKLDYTSSAGLRILLATAKKLKPVGGDLKICCLNQTVQEVFDISGFSTILSVTSSEEEALGAF
jgi:anti-sigma B factor antagonist